MSHQRNFQGCVYNYYTYGRLKASATRLYIKPYEKKTLMINRVSNPM